MALLQQIIQLLSEPPGTVVFHLVTLFALQAVFALSLGQWRQNRNDKNAQRTAIAAAGIFLTRVILMLTGIVVSNNPDQATAVLPPLEQATHTLTAVFLIWALIPRWNRFPQLQNTLLILAIILVGIMYAFFAQEWATISASNTVYNASVQASLWGITQIVLLVLGIGLLIASVDLRNSLRVVILSLLLLSHIAHFWNFPEIIPTETNIAYWIRFGQLLAIPLWAILTYQIASAVNQQRSRQVGWTPAQGLLPSLNLVTQAIRSLKQDEMIPQAIHIVQQMVHVTFVGIGLLDEEDDQMLRVNSSLTQNNTVSPHNWHLDLFDWPSFRLAFEQQRGIELLPNGLGARQLYDLYEELQAGPFGTMLIQPLMVEKKRYGLLLLAKNQHEAEWSHQERSLVAALGNYLGQAIANSRHHETALRQQNGRFAPQPASQNEQILILEEERNQQRLEIEALRNQLLQAEAKAAQTRQQAYSLAATLEELDREERDDKVTALETEIETLRESLTEAEEAMALAAASDRGLSPDWVMHTITRYSAQLEEAQALIQALEGKLANRERGPVDEVIILLAEELRTPVTSISGYTDLMLNETVGEVSGQQKEFLQRVKANSQRINTLLDQIIQLILVAEPPPPPQENLTDVRMAIETAVTGIITQIRENNLRIDLKIADDLPKLQVSPQALHQIVTNLLDNATRTSGVNGRIAIRAHANSIMAPSGNGQDEQLHFVHLEITDSGGGINLADLSRTFDPQQQTTEPLIDGLGDTGAGMSVTQNLIETNGGRIWVDADPGIGTTFSVLFPVPTNTKKFLVNGSA